MERALIGQKTTWKPHLAIIPVDSGWLLTALSFHIRPGQKRRSPLFKLPRSRSSPSPPSSKQVAGRHDARKSTLTSQKFRRRQGSGLPDANARAAVQGWSTSYHAGSSSSGSRESSDTETDDDHEPLRGRADSLKSLRNGNGGARQYASAQRKHSPTGNSSGDSTATASGVNKRTTFTRSRSPAVRRAASGVKSVHRHMSPTVVRNPRQSVQQPWNLLPAASSFRLRVPLSSTTWNFSIDTRKLGESMLLLISLLCAAHYISTCPTPKIPFVAIPNTHTWLAIELQALSSASFIYLIWTHSTLSNNEAVPPPPHRESVSTIVTAAYLNNTRPASPRLSENLRRQPPPLWNTSDFGFVWMSVPKNYRESRDDGILTGLLLGPLIASALLITALKKGFLESLPAGWLIEAPTMLHYSLAKVRPSQAVLLSRYSLVDLSTMCSTILLLHVCASWYLERQLARGCTNMGKPDGERASVPRKEGRRSWYYVIFTLSTSIVIISLKFIMRAYDLKLWKYLNVFEVVVVSFFYQFTLYVALRLAHRGFTLGELGLVSFGGTAICLEFLNITIARIWPITTPYIRTYRLPTPLLTFQIALIVGSLVTGFLLSPFLVLSRNNAQRPVHRLRFPQEKERNRRYYALGFYVGTVLIVGGAIGFWTRWCLGNRDPWLWVLFRILEGRKKWTRPALLSYWVLLGIISVAGWNRQLARSRRFRPRNPVVLLPDSSVSVSATPVDGGPASSPVENSGNGSPSSTPPPSTGPLGMTFPTSFPNMPNLPNLPNLPNGANMSNVATDLLDAADKHVPTLGLNARRKFFHGLAVVMFVPGVAIDPAFTHLSFSAAFALFTFAEYVRYFAIYPFGAAVHLFMNEFLDHKDSGTAILSHFYLLTGCAGSLWLEGPSMLLQFTGILTLGLGDAAASIVGRRLGIHRWSPTSSKTVEGSLAFVASVFTAALLLRLVGVVEAFSNVRYLFVAAISAVLEALSDQNDNLTLPLYMWSMLVVAGL